VHCGKSRNLSGLPDYMYEDRQIYSMQFVENDKKLNMFHPGNPVHSWYTAISSPADEECGPLIGNSTIIALDPDGSVLPEGFVVGMPFHASDSIRQTTYLALGTSNQNDGSHRAFIVRGRRENSRSDGDHQVNLDQGRKCLCWTAVALLAGWRQGTRYETP